MTAFFTRSDIANAKQFWVGADIAAESLKAAQSTADMLVMSNALRGKISGIDVSDSQVDGLRDVAWRYEIAASGAVSALAQGVELKEGSDDERKSMQASAFVAYDLLRAVPTDSTGDIKLVDTLTLCALGYLGDRGIDLDSIIDGAPQPSGEAAWDRYVFSVLYRCWLKLFRPRLGDYDAIVQLIGELRDAQGARERTYLSADSLAEKQIRALRLMALYNMARATELLAGYLRSGSMDGASVEFDIDRHFQDSREAAEHAGDRIFDVVTWWLHAAGRRMLELSIWNYERGSLAALVRHLASAAEPMYQLLPPQREALFSAGVLDSARTAVVVDMPTSSGKTLLAEFRLAQTLAAAPGRNAWAAYVVPTRALGAQITRRLRKDLGQEFKVEALSSAVEVDSLEQDLLADDNKIDILVCTPEKLLSLLRSGKMTRPLALVVLDEAHNIADRSRGIRFELLIAELRAEKPQTEFMLLMPYVQNAAEIGTWLSGTAGSVSLSSTPWKPNDVLIGTFTVNPCDRARDWGLEFKPIIAPRSLSIAAARLAIEGRTPINHTASEVRDRAYLSAAAMAVAFDDIERGANLVMCDSPATTWKVAAELRRALPALSPSRHRDLVKRFIETEVSENFVLADLIAHGIAVHHAGLPEDVKTLIEWLAENKELRAICATSTLAQGINFNVGCVFLATLAGGYEAGVGQTKLDSRDFWNIAGRTGRVGQSNVGVVGLFEGASSQNRDTLAKMLSDDVAALDTHLEALLQRLNMNDVASAQRFILANEQWADFRSYVAHMVAQTQRPTPNDADRLVRATLGYRRLNSSQKSEDKAKANVLLQATRAYVNQLSSQRDIAAMSDTTGFSPDGVFKVLADFRENPVDRNGWRATSLFSGTGNSILPRLIGTMMTVPQIAEALRGIGGKGEAHRRIAGITTDWVRGESLESIAKTHFMEEGDLTMALTAACKAIFKNIAYAAPWGISSLMQIRGSGLDFKTLSDEEKHTLGLLPAFIYHGVRTEDAVAMRINAVPRSIAEPMATKFRVANPVPSGSRVRSVERYLQTASDQDWHEARPPNAGLTGAEYREIWRVLSGVTTPQKR